MDNLTGQTIKGYELQSKLGAGGFGAVYRAHQAVVERDVAIKVILPHYANHPEFIRRFESEAQVVARLEHPHIVPLYDYWREPDGAYLVMRWLQGGSLRGMIRDNPLDPEQVAFLLDQVAAALMVAHRHKVVHRDLKPDNILLDEDGNAYLADFGIAKDLGGSAQAGEGDSVVGSPAYLSPEQVFGQEVTPAADIYSLGITLYELLTGRAPFAGSTTTELIKQHLYERVPSVLEFRPGLPENIDGVIQKATMKDAEERYPDAQRVALAFRQALQLSAGSPTMLSFPETVERRSDFVVTPLPMGQAQAASTPADLENLTLRGGDTIWKIDNPYKGLRAFQEADADDFFGRDALTDQLLARLAEENELSRFLAVVGPSGSGKSSAVHAGLVPALRQGRLPGSERWFVVEMTPGARPFIELEAALLKVAVNAPTNLAQQLTADQRGLARVVDKLLPADAELVLVIDQFEEVFTLVDNEAERALFLGSLFTAVLDPRSRLRLILTFRADFYDRPLLYPAFGDLVRRRTEVVLPLTGAALEEAIVGPAERAGIELDPGLLEAIVGDIAEQPGALPLLQYALTELFERRQGNRLTLSVYRGNGGVFGALARRADELYRELDPDGQEAARQLFLRLVNLGEGTEDTRRRVQRTELPIVKANQSLMDQVIDRFARYRLLTLDRDPITRRPTVEIAHEALIRTWEPLREWLRTSREDVQMQRRLAAAAAEWVNMGEDSSFLASGIRLEQFENWTQRTTLILNPDEERYLGESINDQATRRAADEARRVRELTIAQRAQTFGRAAAVLAVVGTLAVIATVVAILQSSDAQNKVFIAGQTLTPVPPTLTAVQFALDAGISQLATATIAQGQAQHSANAAQTQVVQSVQTLTPVALQLVVQRRNIEALNLASGSIRELLSNPGNPETSALLAIRSLGITYDPLADNALMQAMDQVYTLRILPHKDYVTSVQFSPDGRYLLTGSWDKKAHLWEIATGKEIRQFTGHLDSVESVAFSSDGKFLLTGSKDATARLWDVATGQELRQFTGHTATVRGVAFSPDGKRVLTGSEDQTARLWDVETGQEIRQFKGHTQPIYSVAYSPDGKTVLTGSWDLTARLWDVETGQEIQQFKGHTNFIFSVAYSPDGAYVLTGSVDKTARLWDVSTGKELRQFTGHRDAVITVAFSPDGSKILTSSMDFSARLWDRATGQELLRFKGHTDVLAGAAVSPDGKMVATTSRDQTARLWSVDIGPELRELIGHTDAVSSVAYSPDGKLALTGGYDNVVRLWDTSTYQEVREFTGHTKPVFAVAFSPDGKTAASGSFDTTARLWDVSTGRELRQFTGHQAAVAAVAFSPDGKTLLTGSWDLTARFWDIATGIEKAQFSGFADGAVSVAFSPDGRYAVVGSLDYTARLWEMATGHEIRQFTGHTSAVTSVVFSPDGKLVATASYDHTARLWDVATGKEIRQFVGHSEKLNALAFTPDSRFIVTSSDDRTIRIWDTATGKEVRQLSGHTDAVLSVAVSPDGKSILSTSTDQTARRWDIDYHDFVSYACGRLVRDLTDMERQAYSIADQSPTCQPSH